MHFVVELSISKNLSFYVVNEWNRFDPNICSSSSYHIFGNALLKFIRPVQRKIFNINDPFGIKMLRRLRLGFCELHEHKFRHTLKDTLNPPNNFFL